MPCARHRVLGVGRGAVAQHRPAAPGKGGAEARQHVEVCWGFPPCSRLTLLCSVHLEISFQKAPLSPSVLIEFRTCSKCYLLPDCCAFRRCLVKAPFITPRRPQSASGGKLGFSSLWELPVRKASAVMKVCTSVAALKPPQSCYRKEQFPTLSMLQNSSERHKPQRAGGWPR